MMKSLLFAFTLLSFGLINNYGQEFEPTTKDAELEVTIKGAAAGKVKLLGVFGDGNIIIDSAMSDTSGKVVFKKKERYGAGLYYAVYTDQTFAPFLMDKNQRFFLHTVKGDIYKKMETNSAENKLYYSNLLYESDLTSKLTKIGNELKLYQPGTKEYDDLKNQQTELVTQKEQLVKAYLKDNPGSFFAAFKWTGQNPKLKEPKLANGQLDSTAQLMLYRNEYWDNFDFNDGRMVHTPVYHNKLKNYLTTLFPQRADSVLAGVKFILRKSFKGHKDIFQFTVNYMLFNYQESKIMGGDKIFVYAVDSFYTHKNVFWADSFNVVQAKLKADRFRPSMLGSIGQDLKCKNDKGEYVSLYSIKKPIRVVFLYNPDCEHCIKETPKLKALYDKWKDKMEVFALNVEKDYDKWHTFIKDYKLDWINVIDPTYESKHYLKYHVQITPGLYVLDSNNIIVCKQVMPDGLESVFEKMVK